MSDEKIYMVCHRVKDAINDGLVPVIGAKQSWCCRCNALVWISPASQRIVDTEHAAILCAPCAEKQPGKSMPITAEQMDEVIENLRHRP